MTAFIELEQVSFAWPQGREVLKGVDLALDRRDTLALMGSNGSGKTTLGKVIMGMLTPTAGTVRLEGRPIQDYPLAQRGRRIGYVFQNPERQLFAATVADEIGFALKYRGLAPETIQERVAELLALMELDRYARTFPYNLSHGEKQRLALAAVLALEPEFIILDEPSTGLDWARKRRLATVLARVRRQVGYIIISHDGGFCRELCDAALTLKGGRLV
ncbi:MAG: energy-coupling factor ABC transporter ATP-binding protein [Bacillota bacterium]|jgi:energy-coupling factor transport system ATP-binding protein